MSSETIINLLQEVQKMKDGTIVDDDCHEDEYDNGFRCGHGEGQIKALDDVIRMLAEKLSKT